MSNLEQLKTNIYKYIDNSMDKYALLVNGNWGSGKTYAINSIKDEYNSKNKNNKNKDRIISISLNGVKNIDEVFYKCFIHNKILNTGKNVAKDVANNLWGINIDNIYSPFEHILTKSEDIDLIIFDDIERCKCSMDEIFSYVDRLLNNNIKVLLISDISKLKEYDMFDSIKEKIIGNTIEWCADIESFKSIIDSIHHNTFSSQNLKIFKDLFLELESEMFFVIENEKSIKKTNLRLLNKTIIHSIYIIDLLDCGKTNNINLIYKEIIKNVYVHFHKETYHNDINKNINNINTNIENSLLFNKDSSNIQKIDLQFVQDYFNNGNYIDKSKYSKTLNEFLLNDETLEFIINDKKDEQILIDKANKIVKNINNYPIYFYGQIINTLLQIDFCLSTNYAFDIMNDLINNIKNDNDIIYCLNEGNVGYMNTKEKANFINTINIELKKHNRKIAYGILMKYMYNPYKVNDYMDIFKEKQYVNEDWGVDNVTLLKFISKKVNNKKLLNHLFHDKNYTLYFDYIHKLIHFKNNEYFPYLKLYNSKLERIKNEHNDKYFKTYLNFEINGISNKYK